VTLYDAPNQQVVRADGSGPADEGTGGEAAATAEEESAALDSMTKADLLAYAEANGVEADESMTKADIRAAIDGAA
jgi:hypothetical protein